MEGAKTIESIGARSTASSAIAFDRKKRVRWNSLAFRAEKNTNRSTPVRSAARRSRAVARPLIS
jgi:hypothetical protein